LVKEHAHSVNAAVTGLSALASTAQPMASVKAMSRFLNHQKVTLSALIEPVQDTIRTALQSSPAGVALVVHDWSMYSFTTHPSKTDRLQRTHEHDVGYDVGTALIVEAHHGQPLGPMELRCRTGMGVLSTRPGHGSYPWAHVDEVTGVMAQASRWQLGQPLIHIIDREADSVGHYRAWQAAGHQFVVRAKSDRIVTWKGQSLSLQELQTQCADQFQASSIEVKTAEHGRCRVQMMETEVILDRPARTWVGGKQKQVPGPALPLRLVLTRVIDERQHVQAEWLLLTNVAARFNTATVAQWYTWRWLIESYHKLLKTAGMNAEAWQQESGQAFIKRLTIASMACLAVWHLQQDASEDAGRLKSILIRLSGRQMKHRVKQTAPALLAGLEKLLAIIDLLETQKLDDVIQLARSTLPSFFSSA
jgi:hypothetical protein